MLARYRVSRAAIDLIKRFEGFRSHAAQLPDGRWTIGYGHTLTAREGAVVSEQDAEALLLYDLISIAHGVNEHVYAPLSQNQFDALCSFAFNIGLDAFRHSQALKRLNAGAMLQAACAMELWRKAAFEGEVIIVDALVRRRAAEKALFLTPSNGGWIPAPSSILRPVVDEDAMPLVPSMAPVRIETTLTGPTVVASRDPSMYAESTVGAAMREAAEAVTARLETLLAEPPPPPAEPAFSYAEPEPAPVEAPPPEAVAPEPEPVSQDAAAEAARGADPEFAIPPAPGVPPEPPGVPGPDVRVETGPFSFIPARTRPEPAKAEPSVIWDLLLAFAGVVFFAFGLLWGMGARGDPMGSMTPMMVAGTAGLAGVMLGAIAVFRLLQRIGRAAARE